ncbi:MAG: sulfite exporter TauE/SafE family protein [Candidatus Pacebacteria bacterium]|nr:sulfite exporter TauE/SafE family protein [Candidatus Paceibacterota bacterium]MBP9866933.1 sulfite exporter TauE/SafE family protein [Candidatus Paceibacterota bacterium]
MNRYTFYISGTHCESCKLFVEDALGKNASVTNVSMDLRNETVTIETQEEKNKELFAEELTKLLLDRPYTITVHKVYAEKSNTYETCIALLLGFSFTLLFFVFQKYNTISFGDNSASMFVTSFFVGIVASLSSCLAVVGGLVLSLSTTLVESGLRTKKPFVLFHIGRIGGFLFLGGLLGFVGGTLGVNYIITGLLGILASLVMVVLGFSLLGVGKSVSLSLPRSFFSFLKSSMASTKTPFLVGVLTFFLPCGFTQSMQISALSSGSFISGALIMFFFSLGTLPVLSLVSFGALSFSTSRHATLFFKTVGVVVVSLGLFSLFTGLVGLGIINPLFSI